MDNLSYTYNRDTNGKLLNNRLASLGDAVSGVAQSGELAGGTGSYGYDAIGNLVSDSREGITGIDWNVYGKIKSISKGAANTTFSYDPSGNRVRKVAGTSTSWYVRDAQGNPLAVYDKQGTQPIIWREQQLYGSSRLGMWRPEINPLMITGTSVWNTTNKVSYELTNHLGNVLAVISDVATDTAGTKYPSVLSAQDYYPFGMIQPRRSLNSATYRYGFNGKENDNDVKGVGNQQDYGMRIYDPRVGKFLSVDPITSQYPSLTPYQFASNSPLANVDLDGLEANLAIYGRGGENTNYSGSDIISFKKRANELKKAGFNSVSVNNGVTLVNNLKTATKTEGSISSIVSFTHSGANGIFLDNDAGFYTAHYNRSALGSDINSLSKAVESGEVKFTKNAMWIFASCNAGNPEDDWHGGSLNLARNAAKNLNIETVGAVGYVSPEIVNGKETGRLVAGNAHGSNFEDVGFIKFTPVVIKVKMRNLGDVIFGRPGKDVEIRTGEVKQEKLGKIINPSDLVPKK